jgi:REP element-mobilizing transposase RayT
MRKLRLKNDGEGFYHVGSRCVDRTFRFNDDDKTHIVDQMRRMATFCGIEVNTYVVMTNHFHILVHVLPKGELTDDELVTRVAALYGHDKAEEFRSNWRAYRQNGGAVAMQRLEEERGALLRRMGDLSIYMKELKQWISRDYNRKVGRVGTLWEDRFWSCLLEDSAETLSTVAAYIDRNAVRAGIVERPEDYKWCGYAEAHAGREAAQKALSAIFRDSPGIEWTAAEERYGWLIHAVSDTSTGVSGTPAVQNLEQDAVFRRVLALGSRSFILETYARFQKVFGARKRPAEPYVTDIGTQNDALCASHRPRRMVVG